MEPVKRSTHNLVYRGPTPDVGDLSCERRDGGIYSHWRPSKADLDILAQGGVVNLGLFAEPIPPISMGVKLPEEEEKVERFVVASPLLCDGCEEQRTGCVSVGEEVLCADCLLARATEFGDEVKSLISSWREEAADPAVEPGRSNALSSAAAELQERFDPTETSGGGE